MAIKLTKRTKVRQDHYTMKMPVETRAKLNLIVQFLHGQPVVSKVEPDDTSHALAEIIDGVVVESGKELKAFVEKNLHAAISALVKAARKKGEGDQAAASVTAPAGDKKAVA